MLNMSLSCFSIEFSDVVMSYSVGTQALKGISMQIEDGEFCFLVGPSGSGKSTIIKLITGELQPTSGTVHVNGYSLERIRKREVPYMRRTVGVVFQDFRLISNMTVYENVAFAMRVVGALEKEIRERVPYVLELVGLENKSRRHPTELSGGEQQRVAIARALSMDTKVLLADEPTGNLDSKNSEYLFGILESLAHEDGYCVIIVTHDETLAKLTDRTIRMVDGTIAE